MTPAPDIPEDAPHWVRLRLERQIDRLDQLADAGLALALAAKEKALPEEGEAVEPDVFESLTRTFAKASRAVRLTLMLQARLIKDLDAFDRGLLTPEAPAKTEAQRFTIQRIFVDPAKYDLDGNVIEEDAPDHLTRESGERLDREDPDAGFHALEPHPSLSPLVPATAAPQSCPAENRPEETRTGWKDLDSHFGGDARKILRPRPWPG